jgi:hypothetical protein
MIGAAAILPFAAAAIWRLVVGLQVHSVTPLFRPVRCGPGMLSCAVETLAVASNGITVLDWLPTSWSYSSRSKAAAPRRSPL